MTPADRTLLIVNPSGHVSGAEVVALRLARVARDRGWRVVLAAPAGALAERADAESIARVSIPELRVVSAPRPVAAVVAASRAVRAAFTLRKAAASADVVVANGVLALPALRLLRRRAPVVWIVHDVLVRGDLARVVRSCRAIVALAVAPSESAAAQPAVRGLPVRVVRHGTVWPVDPAHPDRAHPVVGISGVLTPWKGHDVLLDAVALLPTDVILEIMGAAFPKDRDYEEQLRERAARPDLGGRVRFLGRRDDAIDRMRTWTVVVSASIAPEAAGLSVLEAMSIGLPVIGTDHGGPQEWLDGAGLLVPPGDAAALAGAIEQLLDDRDLYERCAAAGPRLVAEEFRLDRQLASLLDTVTSVADGTGGR